MTCHGIVRQLYSERVEKRPFSRFASVDSEIKANARWSVEADMWGANHVDEHGHYVDCLHNDYNEYFNKCNDCGARDLMPEDDEE